MEYYLKFSNLSDIEWGSLNKYRPLYFLSQLRIRFIFLSPVLLQVYKAPTGSAGLERNHGIGNMVRSQRKCCISEESHHRQAVVVHIETQLK